ncbi:MAG: hypothetical protein D9V47_05660 [Clostridia bacterium]|nr:MAG: hypothetical protein D9V47_05660 [Clostridia bacterium]
MASHPPEFRLTAGEKLQVFLLSLTIIPFILVVFVRWGGGQPALVALVAGLAIVAAAYFLSWATESLETVVSQTLALAVLALIQVLPEYSFEVVLAWGRHLELAAATMTGANRLLLGLGWPAIFFMALLGSRRRNKTFTVVELDRHQAVEIVFLLLAALYSLIIVAKASLTLLDAAVLVAIYVAYVFAALRLPRPEDSEERAEGIAAKIALTRGGRKVAIVSALFAFGAFVILFGAEPFIDSLLHVAVSLGLSEYLFVQWVAPFLSEFPESLTAFIWAYSVAKAPMGLANLVSSKLNQWTLLIATIPVAYSLSVGHLAPIPLNPLQVEEILLTAAQTFFGIAALLDLRFGWRQASVLLVLFLVQFVYPPTHIPITIIFLVLAAAEVYMKRHNLVLFREFGQALFPLYSRPDRKRE